MAKWYHFLTRGRNSTRWLSVAFICALIIGVSLWLEASGFSLGVNADNPSCHALKGATDMNDCINTSGSGSSNTSGGSSQSTAITTKEDCPDGTSAWQPAKSVLSGDSLKSLMYDEEDKAYRITPGVISELESSFPNASFDNVRQGDTLTSAEANQLTLAIAENDTNSIGSILGGLGAKADCQTKEECKDGTSPWKPAGEEEINALRDTLAAYDPSVTDDIGFYMHLVTTKDRDLLKKTFPYVSFDDLKIGSYIQGSTSIMNDTTEGQRVDTVNRLFSAISQEDYATIQEVLENYFGGESQCQEGSGGSTTNGDTSGPSGDEINNLAGAGILDSIVGALSGANTYVSGVMQKMVEKYAYTPQQSKISAPNEALRDGLVGAKAKQALAEAFPGLNTSGVSLSKTQASSLVAALKSGNNDQVREILKSAGVKVGTNASSALSTLWGNDKPAYPATGSASGILPSIAWSVTQNPASVLAQMIPALASDYVTQRPPYEQPKLNALCFIAPAVASPLTSWIQSLFGDNQFGEVVTGVLNGFLGYKMYDECIAPYANLYNNYYSNYGSGYTASANGSQYSYDNPSTLTTIFRGTFGKLVQSLADLTPDQLNRIWNTNIILQVF